MVELRQFNLQLALGALGTKREDVEDKARTIDDTALQRTFKVALLRRESS